VKVGCVCVEGTWMEAYGSIWLSTSSTTTDRYRGRLGGTRCKFKVSSVEGTKGDDLVAAAGAVGTSRNEVDFLTAAAAVAAAEHKRPRPALGNAWRSLSLSLSLSLSRTYTLRL